MNASNGNPNSSSGLAEDLIRAVVQFGCAEVHAKTLLEKTKAELENGMIDVEDGDALKRHLGKLDGYISDIKDYSQLRRRSMLALFNMFEGGDKDVWCQIKHLGIGAMTTFEAWEADTENYELYEIANDANKAFVKALTRFLGVEITDCASCFTDMLKASENGSQAVTIKSEEE